MMNDAEYSELKLRAMIVPKQASWPAPEPLKIWLPFLDTYRTMCLAPHPEFQGMLQRVRELGLT